MTKSEMSADEQHASALRYECEELTAEAYKRGRQAGLEEGAKVADEWLEKLSGIEVHHTNAQTYAVAAVEDIAAAVRSLIEDKESNA